MIYVSLASNCAGLFRYTRVGELVPTVTQAEKDERRKGQGVRRRQRSAAGVGNARPLPPGRPGTGQRHKEFKVGLFYDPPKRHCHAFATAGDSDAVGPLLAAHAAAVGFEAAGQSLSLTDGAKWVAAQVCLTLLAIKGRLLHFHHPSQHVHAAATCCLGDTPAAAAWAPARLAVSKGRGVTPVLAAIDALSRAVRSPAKRESLQGLRHYVVARLDLLGYPAALAPGQDIGSRPSDAAYKTPTLRRKDSGLKWDRDHAAAMMNLTALYDSGQADAYWAKAA